METSCVVCSLDNTRRGIPTRCLNAKVTKKRRRKERKALFQVTEIINKDLSDIHQTCIVNTAGKKVN